jgi:signal transduction histidine kinase
MFWKRNNKIPLGQSHLKLRISTFFVITLGIILVTFSFIVFERFNEDIQENFDASLYNYASEIAESMNWSYFGDIQIGRKQFLAENKHFPFTLEKTYLQVINSSGNKLLGLNLEKVGEISVIFDDIKTLITNRALFRSIKLKDKSYRIISFPIIKQSGIIKLVLQIAVPLSSIEAQTKKEKNFFFYTIPILLIVIFITSFYFSTIVLSPLNTIIKKTKTMTAMDLSTRLPVSDTPNELNILSSTLNDLFDRIQKAFESQENFVANASHQLRTPLSILKGEFDLFKSQTRTEEEVNHFVYRSSAELDHLIRIVNDLLTLANLDAGKDTFQKISVQIDEIIFDTISRIKFYAREKNISIRMNISNNADIVTKDFKTAGDPDLLRTMLQAILENAIKHSFTNSIILVSLLTDNENICIKINNQGDPIPSDKKEKIFERFSQFNKENHSQGVGLGLAIAKNIANLHEGDITLESSHNSGTTFIINIKKF